MRLALHSQLRSENALTARQLTLEVPESWGAKALSLVQISCHHCTAHVAFPKIDLSHTYNFLIEPQFGGADVWQCSEVRVNFLALLASKSHIFMRAALNSGPKLNTNFFSQTFRALPKYPSKIPAYPAKKVWFPWLRGTYRTFWPPPLHMEAPHPTRKYPDSKVWVWVPFSCLTQVVPNCSLECSFELKPFQVFVDPSSMAKTTILPKN